MSGQGLRYSRASDIEDAVAQGTEPGSIFLAGGTDVLQLWKAGIAATTQIIDISRLPLRQIDYTDDCLSIGALARLSDVASHWHVAGSHPLIAEAIEISASGQIRNMATVGGNLLQRTRCTYFRGSNSGDHGLPCNKRTPGSGCGALRGENRQAALFGASEACVATHASDLAVALAALDAEISIQGTAGGRRIALSGLYRLPGDAPALDTTLTAGDLITGISVRNASRFAPRSTYLKVRDRASFEFAVVSIAAAMRIENGVIAEARIAAGGVAPMPWRLMASEAALVGRAPGTETFAAAGELAIVGARPLADNGFKVELLKNAVIRALQTIGGLA